MREKKSRSAPLDGAIIHAIRMVDQLERLHACPFKAESLPGHLIHIVIEGEVEQNAGGIIERFGPGDSIWYWENEPVQGRIIKAPWRFYTINFIAPSLPPPPLTERVKPASTHAISAAHEMFKIWNNTNMPQLERHLRLHKLLLEIMIELISESTLGQCAESEAALWWKVEAVVRHDLSQPFRIATICEMFHKSERSLFRACNKATGMPPIRRIRQIRLSYARGLLTHSGLTVSEVAYRVGYKRVQEFSRDYKKQFGIPPSQAKSRQKKL
jgi:AraC-like DNA-binding protein